MYKEFRAFIMKGNLIDLAVAFVLGVAFVAVVGTFVSAIINPLLGLIFGKPDLSNVTLVIGKATVQIGVFLNSVIDFVLIGLALFLTVKVYNRFREEEDARTQTCAFCKTEIAPGAIRCPNCTSQLVT